MADPSGFIFTWLIAYSALLGAKAGVMICDYYIIRKTKFDIADLYKPDGPHKGWNSPAWIAFAASLLPVIPGFLAVVGAIPAESVGNFLVELYSYAWFVTFGLSFFIYYLLKRITTAT